MHLKRPTKQARFYAGARGPRPPVCGWVPQIFEGFPFFICSAIHIMTLNGREKIIAVHSDMRMPIYAENANKNIN